jgi:hypothetical protein
VDVSGLRNLSAATTTLIAGSHISDSNCGAAYRPGGLSVEESRSHQPIDYLAIVA